MMKKKAWLLFACIALLLALELLPYCQCHNQCLGEGISEPVFHSYFGGILPMSLLLPAGWLTIVMAILALLHTFSPKKSLRISILIFGGLAFACSALLQLESSRFMPLGVLITAGLLGTTLFTGFGFRKKQPE